MGFSYCLFHNMKRISFIAKIQSDQQIYKNTILFKDIDSLGTRFWFVKVCGTLIIPFKVMALLLNLQ